MRVSFFQKVWVTLAVIVCANTALAQPAFNVNTTIGACDDYATLVLDNPWDMSDPADINNFTVDDVVDISNTSFGSGLFNFNTTRMAGGHFHFLSPQIENLQPVGGRWGQNSPIDSSRFKHLTVRMNLNVNESTQYGMRVLWVRGKIGESGAERAASNFGLIPTAAGWRSYSVDLSTIGSFDNSSSNPRPWATSAVHGFGLYPMVSVGAGQIDYVRLEDPTSCDSTSVAYTSSVSGNNDLLSFYLDNDSNPFNGYYKKLSNSISAASNGTVSVSSLGMMPGAYRLVARFDSDYAALEGLNPWDMSESADVSSTTQISNITFSGGTMQGTTTGTSPNIYFAIPTSAPINASKYKKLSLKIATSTNTNTNQMLLYWTRADSGTGFKYLSKNTHDPDNDGVYQLDLTGTTSWTGSITSLRLQVATGATTGHTFTLDFLQLRKTGLVTTENIGATVASANLITIADPPRIQVLQPDIKGGELFKSWDLRSGDVGLSYNTDFSADPAFPGEPLTAYLPDVRSIGGTRGNIYKSTSLSGNGDPNDYMNFPSAGANAYLINADEYENLCFRMTLNRTYSVPLGSVTKYFYKRPNQNFEGAQAWATIYDRWSDNKWYEYCMDARNHPTDSAQLAWGGSLEAFRIDPNEFSYDNCCDGNGLPTGNPIQVTTYYDYVRLAKRDRSYGKFALAWQAQDSDTSSPTVGWEYSSSRSFSSTTAIPAGQLSCEGRVCLWNTTSVPNGEYFVRATINDGTSSNTTEASGTLVVENGAGPVNVAPILYIEAPAASAPVCDNLQIKGFSLNSSLPEPVTAVQVFIDGVFQELVVPSEYSVLANINYPNSISDSGFNFSLPISSLSNGAHTVTLTAYSSNGGVASQAVTIQKQVGCVDPVIVDPTPAGVPQTGAGTPLPTPTPGPPSPPKIMRASHIDSGLLTLQLGNLPLTRRGCYAQLFAGPSSRSLSLIKTFGISTTDRNKGAITFVASRVKVNTKKLKRIAVGARFKCGGLSSSTSKATISFKGTGSIVLASQLQKKLGTSLRKSP